MKASPAHYFMLPDLLAVQIINESPVNYFHLIFTAELEDRYTLLGRLMEYHMN